VLELRRQEVRREAVTDKKLVVYEGDGEWSALYVDGKLERVGDHYLITECVYSLLGVEIVQDSAFMRGQHKREGVADTLEELEAYKFERDVRLERAAQLRADAETLLTQADALEKASR